MKFLHPFYVLVLSIGINSHLSFCSKVDEIRNRNSERVDSARERFRGALGLGSTTIITITTTPVTTPPIQQPLTTEAAPCTVPAIDELKNFNARRLYERLSLSDDQFSCWLERLG